MKQIVLLAALFISGAAGAQIDQKIKLGELMLTVSDSVTVRPCETDTIQGVLYWHSRDEWNGGNAWDTAYWVGKCGPMSIPGDPHFIPGQIKITQGYKDSPKQKNWKYQERILDNGKFYTRDWKLIPSADVYGMIPLSGKKGF